MLRLWSFILAIAFGLNLSIAQMSSPVQNWTTPVKNWTTPVQNWTTPVKNWTTPVRNWTTPVQNWTTPVKNWTTPVQNWTTPVKDWTTPVQNWTTPVKDWTTPVENGTTPVNDWTTPVENWTTPVTNWTTTVELTKTVENWTTPVELSKPLENWTTPMEFTTPVENWNTPIELSQVVENWNSPAEITKLSAINPSAFYNKASALSTNISSAFNYIGTKFHSFKENVYKGLGVFTANFDDANKMWEDKWIQSYKDGHPNYFYLHQVLATSLFTSKNASKTIGALLLPVSWLGEAGTVTDLSSSSKLFEQYSLRATKDGFYPVMKRGFYNPQNITWLKEGDVWKYGTTINPGSRYTLFDLNYKYNYSGEGLKYFKEFSGLEKDAVQLQNMKIWNQKWFTGNLPPGNKIIH